MSSKVPIHFTLDDYAKALIQTARACATNCGNCAAFDQVGDADLCKLVNQKPPARIVLVGCDKFIHNDDIPF